MSRRTDTVTRVRIEMRKVSEGVKRKRELRGNGEKFRTSGTAYEKNPSPFAISRGDFDGVYDERR